MPSEERQALRARQLAKLQSLVDVIHEGNAFNIDRLKGVDTSSLESFAATCPFTDKSMLAADRAESPPWGTNLTYPLASYTRFVQTSGTTGAPMGWLDTPESWSAMLDCWRIVYEKAGVRPGADRVFFAFSFGPFLGFWTAFEAAASAGLLVMPSGGMSSSARLEAMARYSATVLCCTPTYALRLGDLRGDNVHSIRLIIVAGEPGGSLPSTRKRLEELWPGARVFDHHGLTEVGPVSYEDPGSPGTLCILEDAYFAEILDDHGNEAPMGGQGELVLTTLDRLGSPLLRYRTGDRVKRAHGTDGALALEGGVLGRIDDMVVVRGVNIYPSAVEEILRGIDDLVEYRVTQRNKDFMAELIVEAEFSSNAETARQNAETALRDAFGLRIPVAVVEDGTLPRFEFKARRWVSES
jgi:phenylacetate-CoA ligase